MKISADIIAGVDSCLFDTREFNFAPKDLAAICDAFNLGHLIDYQKEKNIAVSHSNHFIFLKTKIGQFAIKLYPANAERLLTTELVLNRLLLKNGILTPPMHITKKNKPFHKISGFLATCFDFVNGKPFYLLKFNNPLAYQLSRSLEQIKYILRKNPVLPKLQETASISIATKQLIQHANTLTSLDDKDLALKTLIQAYERYSQNRNHFIRVPVHNNISLTNLFRYKSKIYILDLSHIKIDYSASDLTSLVISCLFFNKPPETIRTLIKKYLTAHPKTPHLIETLPTLLSISLVKEYFKICQRAGLLAQNKTNNLMGNYSVQLFKRKTLLEELLLTVQSKHTFGLYP